MYRCNILLCVFLVVRGVHRDRYQEFMAVLCSYIVEKQKNWQREDIPYELVYVSNFSFIFHYLVERYDWETHKRD